MYVSNGQMLSMVLAPLIPLVLAAGGCGVLYHFSEKKRTGIVNALGVGFLAFLWQEILYMLVAVLLTKYEGLQNVIESTRISAAVVYALVCSIFIALGIFWGVKSANREKQSPFRTGAAGIGFGVGNVCWNILIPYGTSLYYSARINTGSFVGSDELAQSVYALKPSEVMLDSLKGIYLMIIYVALALVIGKAGQQGKKVQGYVTVLLVQLFISLSNALLKQFASAVIAAVVIHGMLLVLTVLAVWWSYRQLLCKSSDGQTK